MSYQKIGGSRVEYRPPHFVAAAVAVVIFVQLLFILHNSAKLEREASKTESKQLPIGNVTVQTARTYFPRKIWQTSKTGPGGFDEEDRNAVISWTKLNQKWRYESVTQYGAESYVRNQFANEPDIIETFVDLQDPILRADLVRYLLLLGDGGLYTDIDTRCLVPVDDWIPPEYQDSANVVVGVEYDRLAGSRWSDWTLDLQFSTWAILAKPRHPLLECTVRKVIKGLKTLAFKQGKTISGVKASREEVLDTTGPAIFTRSVFDILGRSTGTNFTWSNVTDLKVPRLVDDILILPITAFGCGQQHSNSGNPNEETAFVQHMFKGSWKADHQRQEDLLSKPNEKIEEDTHEEQAKPSSAGQEGQSPEVTSHDPSPDSGKDGDKNQDDSAKTNVNNQQSVGVVQEPQSETDKKEGQEQQGEQSVERLRPAAHEPHQVHRFPLAHGAGKGRRTAGMMGK